MLILRTILISTLVLTSTYLQSMESPALAQQYNATECALTSVPDDVLMHIFSFCHSYESDSTTNLENSIKFFMNASIICHRFNEILTSEVIGNFCKIHEELAKNRILVTLMSSNLQSRPATILVYAGANPNQEQYSTCILEKATIKNDQYLVTALLKHNADLHINKHYRPYPAFFLARTIDMAQIFIDKGVDIHETDSFGFNILWRTTRNDYPPDMLKLYLEHGVKTNIIVGSRDFYGCLLHKLANKFYPYEKNRIDEFLVKFRLLLGAAPRLVNTLNLKKQTPLDCIQEILHSYCEARQELEASIRALGGLTAQELKGKKLMLCKK